jgi:hypothetical protein
VNEQGISLREAWDGENLRFTFRRTIDERLMQQCLGLKQIVEDVQYEEGDDCIIWQYSSSGKYSVQTLYDVINNRGVRQIYTPLVWKLSVPSRLHIFLWLLSKAEVLTRDNLAKRKNLYDKSCLFCNEPETISHLFFACCVAKVTWENVSDVCDRTLGLILNQLPTYGFKIRSLKLLTLPLLPLFGLYGNSEMSFVFRV